MDICLTPKQKLFIDAKADEVLFGGAAGGGKSRGQLYDAFLYALCHRASKQLILRRTYPDLERSLIRAALEIFPPKVFRYSDSKHRGAFINGSVIDFGFCDNEKDVLRYQGAEYDTIRFDELTHFSEDMYLYLISRLRGANDYPKQIKSTANPGGVGHAWVKARFVDIGEWGQTHDCPGGTRLFIPSRAQDNRFLMQKDPGYTKRLENLPEPQRRALLLGDWDVLAGRYFPEFSRALHVVPPFAVPAHWRRYFAMDYGLDMLAGYWAAFSPDERCYVYREVYESGLIIRDAAKKILAFSDDVYAHLAPADLWGRTADTGKSRAELFFDAGLTLTQVTAAGRVDGWMNVREWLHPRESEEPGGEARPGLLIFSTCLNLIRTLPMLQHDAHRPEDCAVEPHEITHAPDALRYLLSGRPCPQRPAAPAPVFNFRSERPHPDGRKPGGQGGRVRVI